MQRTPKTLLDHAAIQAGIPLEFEFLDEIDRIKAKPEATRTERERQALDQVREYLPIRKQVDEMVHVAIVLHIMLEYYDRLPPGAQQMPDDENQTRELEAEAHNLSAMIAARYKENEVTAQAQQSIRAIMQTRLPVGIKGSGLNAIRDHLDYKARHGTLALK